MKFIVNERHPINWALSEQICNASRIDLIMRNALSAKRLGEIFRGRQDGAFFIHPSGRCKIADRQTYAPRRPTFGPAMLDSAKIYPLLPQLETAPDFFIWQSGLDTPCNIFDFIFPMLRLYQYWHGWNANYREAICDEDLALALKLPALPDCYGDFGWKKLPSGPRYTVRNYENRDLVCLPISVYQHPLYLDTLTVFEPPCQPEPCCLSTATNGDLFLTSDYAVARNNQQTVFIDQLGLESMNVQVLRWRNLHWILLDDKKESYYEAIAFAAKARAESLNTDFIRVDGLGNTTAKLTIPELVEQSHFSIFALPEILRPQQLGMINIFSDRSRGMFLAPILKNGGFTIILCDSMKTIFHVGGIIAHTLTTGKTHASGWLDATVPRRTLLLINKSDEVPAAEHCHGCRKSNLFVCEMARVCGKGGNAILQTILRENIPEAVVILAPYAVGSQLESIMAVLRSKGLPLIIITLALPSDFELGDLAETQICATCISMDPMEIVIKQKGKCSTLTSTSDGWRVKRSTDKEIQAANRETDQRSTFPQVERLDHMLSPEELQYE